MRFQQSPATKKSETRSLPRRPARRDVPHRIEETGTGRGDASNTDALSLNVVFTLLKNRRRRRVLQYLERESSQCRLGELAEHIAARENDKPVRMITSSERKRAYVALYQHHLPKLDAADAVDFDSDRGTVRIGDTAPQLTGYLEDPDGEASWADAPFEGLDRLLGAAGTVYRRLVGDR